MSGYGVVLFHTTASAMRAERVLIHLKGSVKLIPTPRSLSSDCGIALRFPLELWEEVEGALKANRVETAGLHRLDE